MWTNPQHRRSVGLLAGCLTAVILAAALLTLKGYERFHETSQPVVDPVATPYWGPNQINSYLVVMASSEMYDSRGQRLAIRVALMLVIALILLAPWPGRRFLPHFASEPGRGLAVALITVAGLIAYVFYLKRGVAPLRQTLWEDLGWSFMALGFALVAGMTRRGHLNRLFVVLALALATVVNLPGLVTRLDLSREPGAHLLFIEHHYSIVIGQAERLAAGHPLSEMVTPTYSLLYPLTLATLERAVGRPSLGAVILISQGLQLVYLWLCAAVLLRHGRGHGLIGLLGLLLVVPWYMFNSAGMMFPNQLAWRTLGFPLTLVAIRLTYRWSLLWSSFALGGLSGILLALNAEAGIAATAGLLAVLVFRAGFFDRDRRFGNLLRLIPFGLGFLVAGGLLGALWRLSLGYWPDPRVVREILDRLAFWSSTGFGGSRYRGDPMPLALLGWSVFVLLSSALGGSARHSPAQGVRIGAASITLIWLPYYANRADFWNLSGFGVLFALTAIDAARWLVNGVRSRHPRRLTTIAALAFTATVTIPTLGAILYYNKTSLRIAYNARDGWGSLDPGFALASKWDLLPGFTTRLHGAKTLSGITLSSATADAIEAKAKALARLKPPGEFIYLSPHSYLTPKVAGYSSDIPAGDVVGESLTKRDFERLIHSIQDAPANTIFVDRPDAAPPGEEVGLYIAFYNQFLRELEPSYRVDRVVDGWEVWIKKRDPRP